MFNSEMSLAYLLIAILVGFAILIYWLLQIRQRLQLNDFQMSPEQIWNSISDHAISLNLNKSEMLFGVYQDISSLGISLLVKDTNAIIVGQVDNQGLSRKRKITIGNDSFVIEYPMTWNRTAILRSNLDNAILARYTKKSWSGDHEFEMTGLGRLISERSSFDFKVRFDYKRGEKKVGTIQKISTLREKGKICIFSKDIPLAIRIFILSV